MEKNRNDIPKGWVRASLFDITEINPRFNGNSCDDGTKVSFLPMKAVEEKTGKIDLSQTRKISEVKKGYTPFKNGDVLFAKITPCMENGKIAIANNLKNGIGFGSTEFHVLRPFDGVEAKLLFVFLLQDNYRKTAQRSMTGTAGQLRVPVSFLENTVFPLPPLNEQKRIVAKVEALFTRLEAGERALKKVKAQLKRYRQAVLKYAMEGKLTEEWRKENKITESWKWAKLGTCSELITKGESPKWQGFNYVEKGVLFIRSENVLWGRLDTSESAKIPEEFHKKLKRSQIKANDVLINLVGASIGRCAIVSSNVTDANINQAVALIRLNHSLNPQYLMHLLLSPQWQKNIHGSKVETARPNINLNDLREFEIPLPPLAEQEEIVKEIERRFSVAEEVEKIVEQSLKQAERLRQSILKRAFEGKLVPQNPNDEPAEKLLERIRAEKAKQQTDGQKQRKQVR